MVRTRTTRLLVLALSVFVVVTGCARRPSMTASSAPAPAAPPATATQPAPTPAATPPKPAATDAATPQPAPAPAPVAARPGLPAEFVANDALGRLHFDFDKADIRPPDIAVLKASAKWLGEHPDNLVLIEGHCDARGTTEYNLALGERRARAAMNALVGMGVAASRITIVSYGEESPLCRDESEACWARNRRAMFLTKPR